MHVSHGLLHSALPFRLTHGNSTANYELTPLASAHVLEDSALTSIDQAQCTMSATKTLIGSQRRCLMVLKEISDSVQQPLLGSSSRALPWQLAQYFLVPWELAHGKESFRLDTS